MAFGIDNSSPQTLTFEQIEQQMLSSVLGSTPLAPLVPMMTPFLNQMAGLSGSGWRNPIMDTVLFSNMTPYGTYRSQLHNRFNRVANDALNRQSNAARRGWLEDIGRTMMSFESWKQTDLGQQYAVTTGDEEELRQYYNDYISNEAAGRDGWLAQAGYRFLDPKGYEAAREFLSMAGANLIRNGSAKGRRSAYMQARAVGGMFLGKDGKFDFDSTEYGFMNIGEASAIAAALTKDTDLFSDAGFNSTKIKEATDKLRQKVKDYTKALSPLKDIFGSDIPAMITALENASGQRLSQMSSSTIAKLSSSMAMNMQVGGYDAQQLAAGAIEIQSAIRKMAVPFTNDLGAGAQAMTVLNATVTGMAPASMSLARYTKNVTQNVIRTSNSQGAEYINLAYAAWKNRDGNSDKDFNAFKAEYDALRQEYGADAAILQIGGAADFYQLRSLGHESRYFLDAVREDVGGRIARQENLGTLITYGYMQAEGDKREDFKAAAAAIQGDIRLLGDDTTALDASNLSEGVKAQILAIRNGQYGQELITGFHQQAELSRKESIVATQTKLRNSLDKLRVGLPDNLKLLVDNFVSGKQSLTDVMTTSELYSMADPETKQMLEDVASAVQQDMDIMGLEGKERGEFAKGFLTYALENGYQNEAFTEELIKFSEAKEEMDNIAKGRKRENLTKEEATKWDAARARATYASRGMYMTQYVDQQRFSEYIGTGDGANDRRYAALDLFWQKMSDKDNPMNAEEAGVEVEDMMTVDAIDKLISGRKGLGNKANVKKFREQLHELAGHQGAMSEDAVLKLIDNLKTSGGANDIDLNTLKTLTKSAFDRETDSGTKMEDVYNQIGLAIEKMGKLSEDMDKILTKLGVKD